MKPRGRPETIDLAWPEWLKGALDRRFRRGKVAAWLGYWTMADREARKSLASPAWGGS